MVELEQLKKKLKETLDREEAEAKRSRIARR
jgi:hypothetical protein